MSLMTRSGRVSYEDLKRRDPEFIQRYDGRDSFRQDDRISAINKIHPEILRIL